MLLLKAEVLHNVAGLVHTITPLAGPAMIEWDSVAGHDEAVQRLEKLPDWAVAGVADTPEAKAKKAALDHLRQAVLSKPLEEILEEFLNSDNEKERRLAGFALAAFDAL